LKAFSVLNLQMERDKEDISEELLVQQWIKYIWLQLIQNLIF
jgi:hypothetical protein